MDEIKPPDSGSVDRAITAMLQGMKIDTTPLENVSPAAAVFRSADKMVNGLKLALSAITEEIRTRIHHQQRWQNSIAPIHSLPYELLVNILLATFSTSEWKSVERLQKLSQVCFTWWTMIKTSPRFWDSPPDPFWLTDECLLVLRKSATLPLKIVLNTSGHSTYLPSSISECIDSIESQQHRWQSVNMCGPRCHRLRNWFQDQLPLLEELTLKANTVPWGEFRIAGGPRLRRLDVEYVHSILLLHGSGFAALAWLRLEKIRVAMDDVFTTLEQCPRLQHMVIKAFVATAPPAMERIVVLPLLEELELHSMEPIDLLYIIRHIRADGLKAFIVWPYASTDSTQLLRHFIQPNSLWNTANMNKAIKMLGVKFDVNGADEREYIVLLGAGRVQIHNPRQPWWQDFAEWAKEGSVTTFGVPVQLDLVGLRNSSSSPPSDLNLMQQIASIKSLIFHRDTAERIFKFLAEPGVSATGSSWACPELETITVVPDCVGQDGLIPHIINLLHVRNSSAALDTAQMDGEGQAGFNGSLGLQSITVWTEAGEIFDESAGKFVRPL